VTIFDSVTRIIDIDDILYIPSFQSNLISVSKLIAKSTNVNFNKTGAIIKLQSGEQVMLATKIGELSQKVTYLFCDGLEYGFKELISRVRQVTKDVVKSEV